MSGRYGPAIGQLLRARRYGDVAVRAAKAVAFVAMVATAAAPALAQGFNISQLLGYGFRVVAATPAPASGKPAADALYLQGRLPGGVQDIVARCIIQPSAHDQNNCQRVY